MKKLSAVNLTVSDRGIKKLEKKSGEYKAGFFAGYATCKAQAVYQGYHKDISEVKE